MIGQDDARRIVARFSGLPGHPKTPEGVVELIRAFQDSCQDHSHAARSADELLARVRYCPVPADIRDTARSTREEITNTKELCAACSGTGWRSFEKDGLPFAQRCSCRGGNHDTT